MREYQPKVPYLVRLNKDKEDAQFKKFSDEFKQLHINLLLVEPLSRIPEYAKLLKDLLMNKHKLKKEATVALSESCLAIPQKKIPKKIKDPGGFVINCIISDCVKGKALADSGASINVMPY